VACAEALPDVTLAITGSVAAARKIVLRSVKGMGVSLAFC
jgi:hypothetical protein